MLSLISIPLSLLQYFSYLVSVNGEEPDIVDSLVQRMKSPGSRTYSLNGLVMWRKTREWDTFSDSSAMSNSLNDSRYPYRACSRSQSRSCRIWRRCVRKIRR